MPRSTSTAHSRLNLNVIDTSDETTTLEEMEAEKPGETKHEKFRRLANQRGRKLIDYMKSVGRLGGTQYAGTPEEIERLVARLSREFDFMCEQLQHGAEGSNQDDLI